MLKFFILLLTLIFFNSIIFAKSIEVEVLGRKEEVTEKFNEDDVLTLNGLRQVVTSELEELKLDSKLFWEKIELKKLSSLDELKLLKELFLNAQVQKATSAQDQAQKASRISGKLTAELSLEKLKNLYSECTINSQELKLKTFYILADIEADPSLPWEDLGILEPKNFSAVITDSWKKLIAKELKNFDSIIIIDNEIAYKNEFTNSKSVILKWNSSLKKVYSNAENNTADFELTNQFVLKKIKSNDILFSYDFPVQKRVLNLKNKKELSSVLASSIYNLLSTQMTKLNHLLVSDQAALEQNSVEIKIVSKMGLSEIFDLNKILQERFADIKLTSQMKSFSSTESILTIRANGSLEQILDRLSLEGGKVPLNEQKILIFNKVDKSFAILAKDSNN